MIVEKGHTYAAFADRPFFIGTDALTNAGTARGFDSVVVIDRDDARAKSLPLPLLAYPGAQGHPDDWNTIALGHWGGASTSIALPSQVRAVADITTDPNAAPLDASAPPPGTLTPAACAAPWRRFTAVVALATLALGGAIGFVLGKRSRRLARAA